MTFRGKWRIRSTGNQSCQLCGPPTTPSSAQRGCRETSVSQSPHRPRTRLVAVLVSVGLVAAVSGCNTSTNGSVVGGHTSPTAPTTNQAPSITSPSSTQPVLTTAPSTSAESLPGPSSPTGKGTYVTKNPGIFVGFWNAHGRHLMVNSDGSATVDYRSYVSCSENPMPPCDQVTGGVIVDGGHVTLLITQVVTANRKSTATAIVLTSSDPKFRRGSEQTFVLDGDVITWTAFGTFCDEKAKSDTCGA